MPQFVSTQIGKGTVLQTPTADGTTGQFLKTDGAGNLSFDTVAANPAGSDTQIQFNDGGSFGATEGFEFTDDGTNQELFVGHRAATNGYIRFGTIDTGNYIWGASGGGLNISSATGILGLSSNVKISSTISMASGWVGISATGSHATSTLKLNANSGANTIATIKSHGFHVTGQVTSEPTLLVQTPASHADNAFQVQDSTSAVLSAIDASGNIVAGGDGGTPSANTVRGANGSGTDIAGANLTIAGGRGTGTGTGGHLIFQTAAAGGTGSSLNSLATMLELTDDSKIGFFAATPVVQQAGTGETVGFTAGSGTAVNDDSTFTGNVGTAAYRISDIVKALKNYGLLAAS